MNWGRMRHDFNNWPVFAKLELVQMNELAEFLLARIADDEAEAREAIEERLRVTPHAGPDTGLQCWPDTGVPAVLVGPERVLAECEAKRVAVRFYLDDDPTVMGATLEAMAAIYSDHPGYRAEWVGGADE